MSSATVSSMYRPQQRTELSFPFGGTQEFPVWMLGNRVVQASTCLCVYIPGYGDPGLLYYSWWLCQATLGVDVLLCCSSTTTVVFSRANVVHGVIVDPAREAQILVLGYPFFVAISFTAPAVPA